jgi:phage shock protein PspC (stress-responsive transcriptional regulator)
MKKTISINISGVIFHIEEDGYDKLKSYLSSIQQYFSTYEDSQEIVTDIENRIAEKLLATLKGDDKTPARQAVTLEDVNGLIARMGTVADFEAVEKEEILVAGGTRQKAANGNVPNPNVPNDPAPETTSAREGAADGSSYRYKRGQYEYEYQYDPTTGKAKTSYSYGGRKLARDTRRQKLGGVAAGLAHYFQIDPVWVRVLLVGLVIGFPVISDGLFGDGDVLGPLSGFTVVAYILLWMVLPGATDMEEEKGIRKFYRNPNSKVVGGVASGLGAYFGLDPALIRIAFVLSVFLFGTGVLAYIVLWMVAPEARSVTERMQMAGQPITLSNIENSVKSNLNVPTNAPENILTKLLLLPFRVIAAIFRVLGELFGKTMGGLGSIVRVLFGLLLLIIGFSLVLACLTALGAGIGLWSSTSVGPNSGGEIFATLLREDANIISLLAGFVLVVLPSLAMILTGLMLITRKSLITGSTTLTLLGIWVISGVIVATTVPQIVGEFRRTGKVETTEVVRPAGTPLFTMNDRENDGPLEIRPDIELIGYAGTDIKIVRKATAKGRTREEAQQTASALLYKIAVKDSTVDFAEEFDLPDKARFRAQELDITVYVPNNKPFRMTEDFARFIRNEFDGREFERMPNALWQFTEAGLVGVGFERTHGKEARDDDDDDRYVPGSDEVNIDTDSDETRQFVFAPGSTTIAPNTVIISGNYAVRFQKGTQFKVTVNGNQEQYDAIEATNEDGTLRIEQRDNDNFSRTGLTITLPGLAALRLSGSTAAHLTEFDTFDKLTIDLSGSSELLVKGTTKNLTTDQTGSTKLILRGKADALTATLSGASRLSATQMRIEKADVNTSGAAEALFDNVPNLTQKSTGASKIEQESQR